MRGFTELGGFLQARTRSGLAVRERLFHRLKIVPTSLRFSIVRERWGASRRPSAALWRFAVLTRPARFSNWHLPERADHDLRSAGDSTRRVVRAASVLTGTEATAHVSMRQRRAQAGTVTL